LFTNVVDAYNGTQPGVADVIRPATLEDVELIARVHVESILTLGAPHYPAEVIAEWGKPRTGERYATAMRKGERFFLAVAQADESRALGFSSHHVSNSRHRTAVYVSGHSSRRGVGTALFQAAEQGAHAAGATELHVDASLGAVPFYLAQGFVRLGTGRHALSSGLQMDCVFMRKTLAAH
jgi:GNAT superfamily N-acetyltransferase